MYTHTIHTCTHTYTTYTHMYTHTHMPHIHICTHSDDADSKGRLEAQAEDIMTISEDIKAKVNISSSHITPSHIYTHTCTSPFFLVSGYIRNHTHSLHLSLKCDHQSWSVDDKLAQVQGTGYRVQGIGYRAQGTGYRIQGTGYRYRA